jgi:hypothetical protein
LSDVPVGTDAECSTVATELLAKHKDAMFRVTSVTFNLLDAATAQADFRRELMDKVTVKYTPGRRFEDLSGRLHSEDRHPGR